MRALKFMGMLVFAAGLLGAVLLLAGGVTGLLRIVLALAILPFVLFLVVPRFWLGFFAGDVLRVLWRGRGRR